MKNSSGLKFQKKNGDTGLILSQYKYLKQYLEYYKSNLPFEYLLIHSNGIKNFDSIVFSVKLKRTL